MATGFLFLNDMFGWEHRVNSRTAYMFGALFAIPLALWELQHPQPINLVIEEDLIVLITNEDYAAEFAALNEVEMKPRDETGWIESMKLAVRHWRD
jgi:hypothetical protein